MGRQKLKCCANFADGDSFNGSPALCSTCDIMQSGSTACLKSIQIKGTVEGRAMGGVGLVLCEDHGCNCNKGVLAFEDKYSFWNFSGVSGYREAAAARTCSDKVLGGCGAVVGGKRSGKSGFGGKECRPALEEDETSVKASLSACVLPVCVREKEIMTQIVDKLGSDKDQLGDCGICLDVGRYNQGSR